MGIPTRPPSFTRKSWGAMVRQAWGDEWHKRDPGYDFSNGRKFVTPMPSTSSADPTPPVDDGRSVSQLVFAEGAVLAQFDNSDGYLQLNDQFTITGASPSGFNGTFTVDNSAAADSVVYSMADPGEIFASGTIVIKKVAS